MSVFIISLWIKCCLKSDLNLILSCHCTFIFQDSICKVKPSDSNWWLILPLKVTLLLWESSYGRWPATFNDWLTMKVIHFDEMSHECPVGGWSVESVPCSMASFILRSLALTEWEGKRVSNRDRAREGRREGGREGGMSCTGLQPVRVWETRLLLLCKALSFHSSLKGREKFQPKVWFSALHR